MNNVWRLTLAGLFLGLAGAASAGADAASPDAAMPRVGVRVINRAAVAPDTWDRAQVDISRIFRRAGIDLTWLATDAATTDPELFLVFTTTVLRTKAFSADSLGVARPQSGADPLVAYLFIRQITDVARAEEQPVSSVLAHVSAHELGHLLLATSSHSTRGLMQGRWDRETLLVASQGRLLFTAAEAETMRGQLAATAAMADRSR